MASSHPTSKQPDTPHSPMPQDFSDVPSGSVKTISSHALFPRGLKEIRIDHEGTEYRLRITKLNKLILYR